MLSKPEVKEAHRSSPPVSGPTPSPAYVVSGSSVPHPHSIGHVPAHMHLLCDLLPCPIQSTHALAQQNISQGLDDTRVTGDSTDIVTDAPIREHTSSATHASPGVMGKERLEIEKKPSTSTKKQKKSTR